VRSGAGAPGDVTISNRDLSGDGEGWTCQPLHLVVDVEKAIYYAIKILVALESR